jgi:hypothetical protein
MSGEQAEERTAREQISKHTDSSRSTDSGVSGNAQTGAREIRPIRIQRKRTKGWTMPANTVYVGRPGRWGNPFNLKAFGGDRKKVIRLYRAWITGKRFTAKHIEEIAGDGSTCAETGVNALGFFQYLLWSSALRTDHLHELRGKNLACWCPVGSPCHADVLLKLANAGAENQEEKHEAEIA